MTKTPTLSPRERILVAANDLFRRQGIRGVGVEAIAEAADTNKMTLYRHFQSKDELIAEWVRGVIAQKDRIWDELAANHPDDPAAQLVEWSRRTADALAQMEERGSPIMNALAGPEQDIAALAHVLERFAEVTQAVRRAPGRVLLQLKSAPCRRRCWR